MRGLAVDGRKWGALLLTNGDDPNLQVSPADSSGVRPRYRTVPVVAWVECGDGVVGLLQLDRNGDVLPYLVQAPNVIGFIQYVVMDANDEVRYSDGRTLNQKKICDEC